MNTKKSSARKSHGQPSRDTYDVVVIGSGAAGLSASLAAARRGLSVLMVEKSKEWGGSTSKSAGMVWVPGNNVFTRLGGSDSTELGRQYLKATVGDCTSDEMIDAFLEGGKKCLDFLTASCPHLEFRRMEGYPDYWLDAPGAAKTGRGVEAGAFDSRLLGKWEKTHVKAYFKPMVPMDLNSYDSADLLLALTDPRPWWRGIKLAWRNLKHFAKGVRPLTMGAGLTAAIMHACLKAGVEVKLETALVDVLGGDSKKNERVTGVVLQQGPKRFQINATHGVILACGGFERNEAMRQKYQRHPITGTWTVGVEGNTGDGIEIGMAHGAAIDNMADAIWSPVISLPRTDAFQPIVIEDEERFIVPDRSLPHTLMVNGKGKRFMNEALPYCTAGQGLYGGRFGKGEGDAENMPAWLIFDQQFRDKYFFAYGHLPKLELPEEYYESGALVRCETLSELASAIDVPVDALEETVARFNVFSDKGIDEDFHRGENEHDRFYANRYHRPNPSLGRLEKAPFYATKVYPGDIGTSGGLVIDPKARVTREDGSVIPGLLAAGNTTKSVIGHTYTAGGTSIGAALVFGYIAANTVADEAFEDNPVFVAH
ncbi:MAG: FAD-dependent oxidoreductase [Mobiluncus porci]|uniref:FAD-dependent oxidoreductase n=1 Tax=Mobiluncus porci TaxID=2652278 RepID=UPI0023F3DE28|nr:FAD-dependent oxidoreductase [Mobiluncus porci]MDD7542181.1 FAD-dependent oxidoreductase [Mobiluncus porci]MDY5748589.1 FAD-dependent oxidoreductase [Mobiluncus porci]